MNTLTTLSVYLLSSIFGGGGGFLHTLQTWWSVYAIIAIILSLIFIIGYIYAKIRFAQLYDEQVGLIIAGEEAWRNRHANPATRNERWELIQARTTEDNPESWRVAIIEADIMLDETLKNAGYVGQNLGEKLKGANAESFTTLQDAWEAHKVRNEIAHVGRDFILTQKSAQETITRYARVFKEFGVI